MNPEKIRQIFSKGFHWSLAIPNLLYFFPFIFNKNDQMRYLAV